MTPLMYIGEVIILLGAILGLLAIIGSKPKHIKIIIAAIIFILATMLIGGYIIDTGIHPQIQQVDKK